MHAQAAAQSGPPAATRPQDDAPAADREFDDTRPVARDWLQGAPEADTRTEPADATAVVSSEPLVDQEYATRQFDRTTGHTTTPVATAGDLPPDDAVDRRLPRTTATAGLARRSPAR